MLYSQLMLTAYFNEILYGFDSIEIKPSQYLNCNTFSAEQEIQNYVDAGINSVIYKAAGNQIPFILYRAWRNSLW